MRLGRLVLAGCGVMVGAAGAQAKTWIVAGAMNGRGGNGAAFATEILLVNPDDVARSVTLVPINPPGGPVSDPLGLLLAPGQTLAMPSPLAGPGAVSVSADGGVAVFARIDSKVLTSTATTPAHSSPLPVFDEAALLRAGETGHAVWVSHSRDSAKGSRTNVGLVFAGPGAATVEVLDAQGTLLGSAGYDVSSSAFIQASVSALTALDVPVGRIVVHVTRGALCGYAGIVDNVNGSLALVGLERLGPAPDPDRGERDDRVSVGVAQVAGRSDALWQTDARLANPGPGPVAVTAFLLGSGLETEPQSVFVGPGQTVEIEDVVQSLFNVSDPATGAVLWRANGPILVATRTRDGDSAAVRAFGISSAVPLSAYVASVDPPAQLAGLRQGSAFRTNLFAAAGPAGASADLDLSDEAGSPVATARVDLAPLAWGELALPLLYPGTALPERSRMTIRILKGSAIVQASVVDEAANNPVLFEAVPRGVRTISPSPLFPIGSWGGAPNGMDHLQADDGSISMFRPCQTGLFPQPLWLDADGGFGALGTQIVDVGPSLPVDAIFRGRVAGGSATVQVIPISSAQSMLVDSNPETFALGEPFGPFTGLCPIEYQPGRSARP